MIPAEAIEAAGEFLPPVWTSNEVYRARLIQALEAALPHVQSEATDDALRAAWDRGYATAVDGMKDVPAQAWDECADWVAIGRTMAPCVIQAANPYRRDK